MIDYSSHTDKELMNLFQKGNERSFNELVHRYESKLKFFLSRYVYNEIQREDLVQEVFFRVIRSKKSYKPKKAAFSTWIFTIARNLALDHLRVIKKSELFSIHADVDNQEYLIEDLSFCPERYTNGRHIVKTIEKKLSQINPLHAEAVRLRDIEGHTYEEVQELMDMPMGSVKSKINRGRSQLKPVLEAFR